MAHRKLTIGREVFARLGPGGVTQLLIENGFRLTSMHCPVILAEPKRVQPIQGTDLVVYEQWDSEQERQTHVACQLLDEMDAANEAR